MKKSIVILAISIITAFANSLPIIKSGTSMVKTEKVEVTKKVYMGNFLAIGYLPNDSIYRIDAPIEGVIEMINVKIYQKVNAKKELFIIKGPKLLELESEFINTLIEKEYYENELKRLKPLYEAAVVPKKRFLEIQNMLDKFNTKSIFYKYLLLEWGLNENEIKTIIATKKPIPKIKISSPVSGIVSDINIFPKMYAQRGTHLLTIINPKNSHFEISLPLKIVKNLKIGSNLYVNDTRTVVESISATVDSRTQTVAVHLKPINKSSDILPKEKRNVKLYWPKKAFSLPSSAVIEYNDKNLVFVKSKSGFKPIFIDILARSSNRVYAISDTLSKDSQIAVSGVISLKGALEAQAND